MLHTDLIAPIPELLRRHARARGGHDGKPRLSDPRGVSDNAHDPAVAGRAEMGSGRVAAMNRAVKAGIDLAAPIFGSRVEEALAQGQPGIVDQDVQSAEVLDDGVHHLLDGSKIGNIGPIAFGRSASGRDLANERLHILP